MKFQGMARRKKGPRKWLDCGRLRRLILLLGRPFFSQFRRQDSERGRREFEPPTETRRVAGLDCLLPARPRAVRRYMPHLRQFKAAAKRKQR
jgi:hypothetical protein